MSLKAFGKRDNRPDIMEMTSVYILKGLGGEQNIIGITNCITRLRVKLVDDSLIDERELKRSGALGIMRRDDGEV